MQEIQEMQVQSLDQEDLLEEEVATHSSILTWKIPWTEEPGRLQSIGLQRVRHELVTKWQQQGYHLFKQLHLKKRKNLWLEWKKF